MRFLIVLTALLLFAVPARAGDRPHHGHGYHSSWDDVAPDGPHGQGDVFGRQHYQQYYDPYYYWQPGYYRDGFSISYDDGDWSASFSYGNDGRRYYRQRPWRNHAYGCSCYDCGLQYSRNRVYYSPDGETVRYFGQPDYADYYYSDIRPVYQRYPSQPIYSSPGYFDDWRRQDGYDQDPHQTVNIYNYYGEDGSPADVNGPDQNPPERFDNLPPVAPPPAVTAEPGEQSWGRLFHGSALFKSDAYDYSCTLSEGQLRAGPETGPGVLVAEGIDHSLGVLATYHPQEGMVFVFASHGTLTAAYESVSGWGLEPLPVPVDYAAGVSLGNMGGFPWVVFNSTDGTRYVYSYSSSGWQIVGSGATPAD